MSMYRHQSHEVPGLNTSSLPDLIFSVLFFFMIVTHMRKANVLVKYTVPAGTELTRLTKRSATSYIYVGTPMQPLADGGSEIQLNDKLVSPAEIETYMIRQRKDLGQEDKEKMQVSIKADRKTKMGVITDIKQALRKANVLQITYSGTTQKSEN